MKRKNPKRERKTEKRRLFRGSVFSLHNGASYFSKKKRRGLLGQDYRGVGGGGGGVFWVS